LGVTNKIEGIVNNAVSALGKILDYKTEFYFDVDRIF
jgi:hypothetical protein